MGKLAAFARLAALYSNGGQADLAVVYIEEAHPTDGWLYPAVSHFVAQHTALEGRLAAAAVLREAIDSACASAGTTPSIALFTDTMANTASLAFGALPERLVVLLDGRVEFIGGPGPGEYSMPAAETALAELLRRR